VGHDKVKVYKVVCPWAVIPHEWVWKKISENVNIQNSISEQSIAKNILEQGYR